VTARPPTRSRSELSLKLAAEARYVAVVRRALETLLEGATADAQAIADVNTTVTEACMNVVRHAYRDAAGQVEVDARLDPGRLAVSVRDRGRGIRSPRTNGASSAGLGMFLIRALSDELEVRTAPSGTQVLMEFDLRHPGSRDPVHDAASRVAVPDA
jgi:serine/threonine-protein kinase RsbW